MALVLVLFLSLGSVTRYWDNIVCAVVFSPLKNSVPFWGEEVALFCFPYEIL